MKKTAVYDLNGTLVPSVTFEAMAHYERKLVEIMGPLEGVKDDEAKKSLKENGIGIEGKNISKKIRSFVIESIKQPKRGTKARGIYYDLLELAYERGEISTKALPDALAEGNTIDRDKKEGLWIVALSRGSDTLLAKILKFSGLDGKIEKIYSTLPFGGEKTAQAYAGVYALLKKDGLKPVRFYEDEFPNVRQLFEFGISIARKRYPFEIVWVNRNGESREKEILAMEEKFREKTSGGSFGDFFRIVPALR